MIARNIIKTMREFVHFGASGGLIFCTNLAVTALCHEFIGVPVNLAYICGFITTMFVSFLLCRHVIFDAASGDVKYQFLIFFFSSIFFRGFEYLSVVALHSMFQTHYLVALASIQIISFIIKFFYYRGMVFTKPRAF